MLDIEPIQSIDRPVDYRQVGSLLDRMAQSRLLLNFLRCAAATKVGCRPNLKSTVCAFGSLGRGEYDLVHSDIDLMFIGFSTEARNQFLRRLSSANQCFNFENLPDLLASKASQAKAKINLRFPTLRADFFQDDAEEQRRRIIQFLLESMPLCGDETHSLLIKNIVTRLSLVPQHKRRQTPQNFIAALDAFYSGMELETRTNDGKASDYFAKYVVVRVLGEHLTRLALVQATFCRKKVRLSGDPPAAFAKILRQPALSKLLFWSSREFLDWHGMRALRERHSDLTQACITRALGDANLHALSKESHMGPDEIIGTVVVNAAKAYSATLDLLHAAEFRSGLKMKPANIVNWNSDPDLKQIHQQVVSTSKWLRGICQILLQILPLAEELGCLNKGYTGSGLEVALRSFEKHLKESPY